MGIMPENLPSWGWWFFSVVVVGIAINLVSHYLIPYLDRYWEKRSETRRLKNEKKQREFEESVNELLDDPMQVLATENKLTRQTIWFVAWLGIGMYAAMQTGGVDLIDTFWSVVTLISITSLLYLYDLWGRNRKLLREYNERRKEQRDKPKIV
jgi:hypothetical protein